MDNLSCSNISNKQLQITRLIITANISILMYVKYRVISAVFEELWKKAYSMAPELMARDVGKSTEARSEMFIPHCLPGLRGFCKSVLRKGCPQTVCVWSVLTY